MIFLQVYNHDKDKSEFSLFFIIFISIKVFKYLDCTKQFFIIKCIKD
jgi:hypothetical protein